MWHRSSREMSALSSVVWRHPVLRNTSRAPSFMRRSLSTSLGLIAVYVLCLIALFPSAARAFVDSVAILDADSNTISVNVHQVTVSCTGPTYCGQPVWGLYLEGWLGGEELDDGRSGHICTGKLPGQTCGPRAMRLSWDGGVLAKDYATVDIYLMRSIWGGENAGVVAVKTVTILPAVPSPSPDQFRHEKNNGDCPGSGNPGVCNPCNPANGNK